MSTNITDYHIANVLKACVTLTVGHIIGKSLRDEQGGVENVQYATNHKRKGGGSARAVRSARSASHLEPGLFLAIFLPGIDFVVVQHFST